jgi:AraC family transcriptional regulator, transcriptional activator of the genes for pyochelin and ferripyochelin receptors
MTNILTEEQIDEIEQETLENLEVSYNTKGFDKIEKLRNSLHDTYYQIVELQYLDICVIIVWK